MELITVKSFDQPIQAHLCKSRLQDAGIPVFLFDENMTSVAPFHTIHLGGVRLKVPEERVADAIKIIEELDNSQYTNEEGEPVKCPECGSENLHSGINDAKGLKRVWNIVSIILFGIFAPFTETKYECKDCGQRFERP
ncbi:MAG: DUF2007 domain-containing protein [Cyclobacteriaceae bacterium]